MKALKLSTSPTPLFEKCTISHPLVGLRRQAGDAWSVPQSQCVMKKTMKRRTHVLFYHSTVQLDRTPILEGRSNDFLHFLLSSGRAMTAAQFAVLGLRIQRLSFAFSLSSRICVISCIVMMSWKLAVRLFWLDSGYTNENMKNLQVTDLEWPEGSATVHTPFAIVVQCQHKRYAEIDSVQKALLAIRYYKDEQIIREHLWWPRLYFE